jgi:hypothetical protein
MEIRNLMDPCAGDVRKTLSCAVVSQFKLAHYPLCRMIANPAGADIECLSHV